MENKLIVKKHKNNIGFIHHSIAHISVKYVSNNKTGRKQKKTYTYSEKDALNTHNQNV